VNLALALIASKPADLDAFVLWYSIGVLHGVSSIGALAYLHERAARCDELWAGSLPVLDYDTHTARCSELLLARRLRPAFAQALHIAARTEMS
jgi:hypothetical protein